MDQIVSQNGPAERAVAIASAYGFRPDHLIEIFHDLQDELGHVPESCLSALAMALNLSRAEVYGVLTFYHDFRRNPAGTHIIKLCRAESCQAMGAAALIANIEQRFNVRLGETSSDGRITLEPVYCLGLCAASPAAMVDKLPIAKATADKIAEALS